MFKQFLKTGAMLISLSVLLSGCGTRSNTTGVDTGVNATGSAVTNKDSTTTQANNGAKEKPKNKSNLDMLQEQIKQAATKSRFATNERFGDLLGEFGINYKNDIINPYNKGTKAYIIDRMDEELKEKDFKLENYSASFIAIINRFCKLEKLDKTKITYGCNETNKGMVMAFAFVDGFYLYEIDEKGNKLNDRTLTIEDIKK